MQESTVDVVQGWQESILWDLVFTAKSSAVNLFTIAANSAQETIIISMDTVAGKEGTISHREGPHTVQQYYLEEVNE